MGGSTTDERYLNLNDTWSEQLELNFKKNNKSIDVVNAGIDGQSSFGHIWNFKIVEKSKGTTFAKPPKAAEKSTYFDI